MIPIHGTSRSREEVRKTILLMEHGYTRPGCQIFKDLEEVLIKESVLEQPGGLYNPGLYKAYDTKRTGLVVLSNSGHLCLIIGNQGVGT